MIPSLLLFLIFIPPLAHGIEVRPSADTVSSARGQDTAEVVTGAGNLAKPDRPAASDNTTGRATTSNDFKVPTCFGKPWYQNHRLDACLRWQEDCGEPAANAWCRVKGFSRAESWQIDPGIGTHSPTYTFQDGWICDQPFCDGFLYITCTP